MASKCRHGQNKNEKTSGPPAPEAVGDGYNLPQSQFPPIVRSTATEPFNGYIRHPGVGPVQQYSSCPVDNPCANADYGTTLFCRDGGCGCGCGQVVMHLTRHVIAPDPGRSPTPRSSWCRGSEPCAGAPGSRGPEGRRRGTVRRSTLLVPIDRRCVE